MCLVNFKSAGISIKVEKGTTLAVCIRKAGLSIETPCNCIGVCGKCKVYAIGELSEITAEEKAFLKEEKNVRLACITKVMGEVEIELLKESYSLKTIDRDFAVEADLDSEIIKVRLEDFDYKSSKPSLDNLNYLIESPSIYEKLVKLEGTKSCDIYGIVYGNKLIDLVDSGAHTLGVAIDIGTTGISAYLVNLENGETLKRISCVNPQTEFGGDVISRISLCINDPCGLEILKESILNKVNEIIVELTKGVFEIDEVYRVTIAGNTTMLHLFLGISPITLAKAPYRPVFLNRLDLEATKVGLIINKNGIVTLLPSASGYVGADILSGVIATSFHQRRDCAIFIDIGTNGEIVAISGGRMLATSTAAGPAFEGMNIDWGLRAEEGAIDKFIIDENYEISYSTIGGAEPRGICGSGLMDVMASLVERGVVLSSGRFNDKINHKIKARLRDKKFFINDTIYISQKDIRQIQLAKGAIGAGIRMLLMEMDIPAEDLSEVVIAGAFGYHINPLSIKTIGIIPSGFRGKITFVGNSSMEGARLALMNKASLKSMEELKNKMEVLELSTQEKFQEYFVQELSF
jgi:uncharacterized 2Fe-2S/4Fe-4S cluster protein (DUF4445 family)